MIEQKTLEKKAGRSIDSRPILAFFLTMFAMVVVFSVNMIVPFGSRNVLTSDLAAQYGPYLIGLKQQLTSGQSLFYSRSLGIGANTMGVFGYYLSSPINLVALIFPTSMIQEMVTLIIILKLAFAGAFMTWLLDRKFKSEDKMSILFGMMYPLCSFVIIFMFNIMWLDGIALLPLLILLTEKFIDRRKTWPVLTLLLLMIFVSGYYMAYMVGAFSFIYLLAIMGYKGKFKKENEKEGLATVGLFILSAVTAAMMSACILLPAGLNTIGNPDYNVSDTGITMQPQFKLLSIVDQLTEKKVGNLANNLPYIFCGIAALFLCILFFINPKIKKNLKIAIGVAFGFGILCFHFSPVNLAWHLFDDPNWFNYRYSYLFSFVMILVAYYSYLNMHLALKKHFFITLGIVVGMAVFSQSFGQMSKEDSTFFATILFAVLICILLYGKTLEKWPDMISNIKRLGTAFLAIVIVIEIVIFNPRCFMPEVYAGMQDAPNFRSMLSDIDTLSGKIEDDDWFRTDLHQTWHYLICDNNLPFYTGKEGMSIFASMANKKTNRFLKQLGYNSNYNYFSLQHDNEILPSDSILGVRYIITEDENMNELQKTAKVGDFYLYRNDYALSAAFLAEADAGAFDGYALEKDEDKKDYFDFQEKWISSLSGKDASDIYETWTPTWEVLNGQQTDIPPEESIMAADTLENTLNLEKKNLKAESLRFYLRNNDKAPMVLRTVFKADRDGAVYFSIPFMHLQCRGDIYINGEQVYKLDSSSFYSRIFDLGYFKKGDEITLEIRSNTDVYGSFAPILAYMNPEAMAPQKEALSQGTKSIVVENGHYEIETESDADKLLVITAPYEDGWKAYVDGQEVCIEAYQDALLSIPLTAGSHKIELCFTPPGWKAGLLASAAGVVLFAVVSVVLVKKKKESAVTVSAEADNSQSNTEEEKK